MEIKEIVRHNMIKLREERSWTQTEVASRLNISQRAYSHYENGSRNLPIELLADLAELYGISVSQMLGEEQAH